ncbi:hypothetical protein NDU88_006714 [Pleurodeles waltl]|uniref:Uncharacterized protein n=1 Tax=Pleurodeles waltl TaxID=8319 RepID=A0AAV7ME16_PLEWA|nr:hypothetical protein NDU88_006714 [Pleurodeles waltl]
MKVPRSAAKACSPLPCIQEEVITLAEQEDVCTSKEQRVPLGFNQNALPFLVTSGSSYRGRPEEQDFYNDSIASPSGTMSERKNSGSCLEFVDLFTNAGLNQPLNMSRLLALFHAEMELRVLSSSDMNLVKLGSKQQWFDCDGRCVNPAALQGGSTNSCPAALVEFALPSIARLILRHADCFHIMGVGVLPYPDTNLKEIGLAEQ